VSMVLCPYSPSLLDRNTERKICDLLGLF